MSNISTQYSPINEDIQKVLTSTLGSDKVIFEHMMTDDERAFYSADASELRHTPEGVLYPTNTEEVAEVMRLASTYNFPIIPRGGGTGLAGGCLAREGGLILSLEKMTDISIDATNMVAKAQAGAITQTLRDAAAEHGLFYAPDPAGMDKSTIGGNVATNAGGPCCVKYGTTKDFVLGLTAVLPDGEIIHTGVATRKGVVGYDMTSLITGCEGTLAIITELTVKLIPLPQAVSTLAVVFEDLHNAMEAVSSILTGGVLPSALEFMDHKCLNLVADLVPYDLPEGKPAMLIIETDGALEQTKLEIESIAAICKKHNALHLIPALSDEERQKVWAMRRPVSLRIHDAAGLYMSEDIAVPIGSIAHLVSRLPEYEETYDLIIYAFGHCGDGNIHLNFTASTKEHAEAMLQAIIKLLKEVLSLNGTISGEHGIGEAKMEFLPMEIQQRNILLQQGIKTVFDPKNILNPAKLF
ncbi:MAG: FAD-binding oxidoreductase [Desulfovibrio sp.]